MNKLSYGLLGLLSTEPLTGYDLTLKINRFWRSTHSAIYPLLSELMENGFVEFINEKQSGKPDKKIYSLTDSGKMLVKDWYLSETSEEVIRDEIALKLFCIKCMDEHTASKIFDEFEKRYLKKIDEYENSLEKLRLLIKAPKEETTSVSSFGGYILTQRALNKAKMDLDWCRWARKLYNDNDSDFLKDDYTYLDL